MFEGRAWRVARFGDPMEGVELQEMAWEEPPVGELLVRTLTAGAGFPDLFMANGHFPGLDRPPFGLGEEVAGEVVAVGPGSRFKVGDRVMGVTPFAKGWGGYADFAYLRERQTAPIPENMSDEQAGGFPIGFRTAYITLVRRSPLQAGQTMLVLGAAGSAGSTAMQLGKAFGARVVAVAGSDEKLAFCKRFGADAGINYRTADLAREILELTDGRGVDLIYDTVGGETATTALRAISREGRIAIVGLASGSLVSLSPLDMVMRNYTADGVLAIDEPTPERDAANWERMIDLATRGEIVTPVGTVYAFEEVPAMIRQQASPPAGKSVVRVAS